MPLAPPLPAHTPAEDTAQGEITLREIAKATGKGYSALQSRRVREGWPSRTDPRLDDGNRAANRRLYRIADLPADIRAALEPRRRRAPGRRPAARQMPPRHRRKFLDLRA